MSRKSGLDEKRREKVERQIAGRGVRSQAVLRRRFDEYIWLDRTRAVAPLEVSRLEGLPDTYAFGL